MITKTKIKIAHSPDSDDAFMFYAIKEKKIDLQGLEFEINSAEIETLNEAALCGNDNTAMADIFAVSFHAYAYLCDRYQILKAGASMGGPDYGPRLVCKQHSLPTQTRNRDERNNKLTNLNGLKIAIPGKLTSAYLCLQLYDHTQRVSFEPVFCSFNEVFDLLEQGKVDASLLIHESQLKYADQGYQLLVDLGQWWHEQTGLSMPLGCNVIDRKLGQEIISKISQILQESIKYGLANFDEALSYARQFAQNGLSDIMAQEYIRMYVNEKTICLQDDDIRSVKLMLEQGQQYKLIDNKNSLVFDLV